MIRTRKLIEINKNNKLSLDKKFNNSLEHLISAFNDWGYYTPKTLDIFLNELKKFMEIKNIYSDDIDNFLKKLPDDDILEYAWEVETLSSINEIFKNFDSNLELGIIFQLISDYFENKSDISIKDLEGKIIVKTTYKNNVEKILMKVRNNTNLGIYAQKDIDEYFIQNKLVYEIDIYGELVFNDLKSFEEKCFTICQNIELGNWKIIETNNTNKYFEALLDKREQINNEIKFINIKIK